MGQQMSDAAAFRRLGAFVVAAIVTPFALIEYDIRMAGGLRHAFVGALALSGALLVQPRFPPLRYAAAGIVIGVAACFAFVSLVFNMPGLHMID